MADQQHEEILTAWIAEAFTTPGYQDCFLVELAVSAPRKIEVFMDADSGIDFDKCQFVSRFLEARLDAEGLFGEAYTLEVSSPGMSRPLAFPRQFIKHVGRLLRAELAAGGRVEGQLVEADETGFALRFETKRKEGKKNIKEMVTRRLLYTEVSQAKIQPDFKGAFLNVNDDTDDETES
jgi:ribosome maturation factor RimP